MKFWTVVGWAAWRRPMYWWERGGDGGGLGVKDGVLALVQIHVYDHMSFSSRKRCCKNHPKFFTIFIEILFFFIFQQPKQRNYLRFFY